MYFNFDDNRPDTPRIPQPLSRREVVLIAINIHAFVVDRDPARAAPAVGAGDHGAAAEGDRGAGARRTRGESERERERARFVFVQPRLDMTTPKVSPRADLSDKDRRAQTRGARAEADQPAAVRARQLARADGGARPRTSRRKPSAPAPPPQPADGEQQAAALPLRGACAARTSARHRRGRATARAAVGVIADAIRNVRRYAQQRELRQPPRRRRTRTSASRFSSTARASSSARGWRDSSPRCAATG